MLELASYIDRGTSASLVTEKTGLAPSDLDALLQVTAGTAVDPDTGEGVTVYRPYYVAAKLLATRRTQLTEAEGVGFVDPLKVAEEYLRLQAALDSAFGLSVPAGTEAVMKTVVGQVARSGYVPVIGTW